MKVERDNDNWKIGEESITNEAYQFMRKYFRSERDTEWGKELDQRFEGLKPDGTVKERIAELGDKLGSLTTEIGHLKDPDSKPQTNLEVEKAAQLKIDDVQKEIAQERLQLFRQSATNDIRAHLVSKGWKESYESIIPGLVSSRYGIEKDGESILFRDRSDSDSIMAGSASDRADEIAKAYPDMLANPKAGFGNGSGTLVQEKLNEHATTRQQIEHGLRQELAAKNLS